MASPLSSSFSEFSPFSTPAGGSHHRVSRQDMEPVENGISASPFSHPEPASEQEPAFALIDKVLPFEACLYHQVVPLSLVDRQICLGMVNLQDTAALEYARRIISFLGYSLIPQTLSSESHHSLLSAYLNFTESKSGHAQNSQRPSVTSAPPDARHTHASMPPAAAASEHLEAVSPSDGLSENELSARETLVLDTPEILLARKRLQPIASPQTSAPVEHPVSAGSAPSTGLEAPTGFHIPNESEIAAGSDVPTVIEEPPDLDRLERRTIIQPIDRLRSLTTAVPQPKSANLPLPGEALPILKIRPRHLESPPEFLRQLPPDQLLQELLGRILSGGIGRLYFERRAEGGRVLWSDSGILQAPVENLSAEVFQSLLDYLKRLTSLPIAPVDQPTQVEIERMYQKNRILLRLRLIPKPYGEEATLQVLRGAALKFYQRQQLTTLSRDTLSIAKELQKKINELHDRANFKSDAAEQDTEVPELDQVIGYMEAQLARLKALKHKSPGDQAST